MSSASLPSLLVPSEWGGRQNLWGPIKETNNLYIQDSNYDIVYHSYIQLQCS